MVADLALVEQFPIVVPDPRHPIKDEIDFAFDLFGAELALREERDPFVEQAPFGARLVRRLASEEELFRDLVELSPEALRVRLLFDSAERTTGPLSRATLVRLNRAPRRAEDSGLLEPRALVLLQVKCVAVPLLGLAAERARILFSFTLCQSFDDLLSRPASLRCRSATYLLRGLRRARVK